LGYSTNSSAAPAPTASSGVAEVRRHGDPLLVDGELVHGLGLKVLEHLPRGLELVDEGRRRRCVDDGLGRRLQDDAGLDGHLVAPVIEGWFR
jgi:hypothetical protein